MSLLLLEGKYINAVFYFAINIFLQSQPLSTQIPYLVQIYSVKWRTLGVEIDRLTHWFKGPLTKSSKIWVSKCAFEGSGQSHSHGGSWRREGNNKTKSFHNMNKQCPDVQNKIRIFLFGGISRHHSWLQRYFNSQYGSIWVSSNSFCPQKLVCNQFH